MSNKDISERIKSLDKDLDGLIRKSSFSLPDMIIINYSESLDDLLFEFLEELPSS